MKQDFSTCQLKVGSSDWFSLGQGRKGHYILDFMEYAPKDEAMKAEEMEEENKENDVEEIFDSWFIEPSMEEEAEVRQEKCVLFEVENTHTMAEEAIRRSQEGKVLKFSEVYVDAGNLARRVTQMSKEAEVSMFGSPEWDFKKKEIRKQFLELVKKEGPYFIWMVPPCTKWSLIQCLNMRTDEQIRRMMRDRDEEEDIHMKLTKETYDKCQKQDTGYGFEYPHGADAWETRTINDMRGYRDAVCHRCRTGLQYYGKDNRSLGFVKIPTRARTNSKYVFEVLNLSCICRPGTHVVMDGKSKQLKQMQNYEDGFVRRAVRAILKDMEERWRRREVLKIFVAEELEEKAKEKNEKITEEEKKMMKSYGK